MSVLDTLKERGFLDNCTDEAGLEDLMAAGPITVYIGFDPTADSLHAGSLVQIMTLAHMQRAGHRVIAIVGGGTAMVGDPSGKTELRKMLTREDLQRNKHGIASQLQHFIDLDGERGLMVDNADWLLSLNYIQFLREIGRHSSVNRMLTAESYRQRMEKGLSFLEFNYQILQAYDFLVLYQRYGCLLQAGGSDQWGNIVAGMDLIRRVEGAAAFGLTTPLVTTSTGEKMGKTAAGAVWLDAGRLSPYDYFQYWRNTQDADVGRFLRLFTFLPMEEIRRLESLEGAQINQAKERLAYETTALLHGKEEAERALHGARAAFAGGGAKGEMPTHRTPLPLPIVDLLVASDLCSSKGDARRHIKGGAIKLGNQRISDRDFIVTETHLDANGAVDLWRGKKTVVRLVLA